MGEKMFLIGAVVGGGVGYGVVSYLGYSVWAARTVSVGSAVFGGVIGYHIDSNQPSSSSNFKASVAPAPAPARAPDPGDNNSPPPAIAAPGNNGSTASAVDNKRESHDSGNQDSQVANNSESENDSRKKKDLNSDHSEFANCSSDQLFEFCNTMDAYPTFGKHSKISNAIR